MAARTATVASLLPGTAVWTNLLCGVDWGYTNPAALVFALDGDSLDGDSVGGDSRAWQLDACYRRRAPLDADLLPALLDLTHRHHVLSGTAARRA